MQNGIWVFICIFPVPKDVKHFFMFFFDHLYIFFGEIYILVKHRLFSNINFKTDGKYEEKKFKVYEDSSLDKVYEWSQRKEITQRT